MPLGLPVSLVGTLLGWPPLRLTVWSQLPMSIGCAHSSWCPRTSNRAGVWEVCWLLDRAGRGASGDVPWQ